MAYIADLHTHSYLSRATSKQCTLPGLHAWAQRKGVRLVGTGDCTHPAWYGQMKEMLVESAPGLYRLRDELAAEADEQVPASCRAHVDFIITGEISSIYKRGERVRKVHSLVLLPDLDTAARINARLDALGNIKSDGRPILGLDPRDLLQIMLEANPRAVLIPAHIWTPWFSMLGSKSGFDSLQECFGDLSTHIFAAETGLSSDPPMNWRVSGLDELCLVSNSDLHSPANMGRNANVFRGEPDYFALCDALRSKDPARCGGTIDLFPEEGKYHCDGHRKCGVCLEPEESLALDGLCPACGKPLVLGVLHRVAALADRPKGARPDSALPCEHIIPLAELLAEIFGCGTGTKKVAQAYQRMLQALGPEMGILREVDTAAIDRRGPSLLGEAVRRVRAGRVICRPGYDGEYGEIRVFAEGEKDRLLNQALLFAVADEPKPSRRAIEAEPAAPSGTPGTAPVPLPVERRQRTLFAAEDALIGLNEAQRRAASAVDRPVIIVAGPGTGKTRTLTHRVAHLVSDLGEDPESVLAVTFTNRAADEMAERLRGLLGQRAERLTVSTFHAFCLAVLRRFASHAGLTQGFVVVDRQDELRLLRDATGMKAAEAAAVLEAIHDARRRLGDLSDLAGHGELSQALSQENALALDEIVPRCVRLLCEHPEHVACLGYRWVCVDEYQDINRGQYELVRLLSPVGDGLCAIGDPDQAIYAFRGSDVAFFLRFTRDFPGAEAFDLTENYRSSEAIVSAAAQVVGPSKTAMSVAAASAREAGVRIRFHRAATAAAEAEFVTHEIEKLLGGTALFSIDTGRVTGHEASGEIGLGDVAVLVRLRALMGPMAEALTRLGLPVQTVGDRPFVDLPGARDLVEALRRLPGERQAERAVDVLASGDATPPAVDAKVLAECRRLAAARPDTLACFLDRLLLRQPADSYEVRADRIALMTLHAAKGLEFPVVFVVACEAGIVPYDRPGDRSDLDEERRLLYVGMTRAQRVLYITSARRRTLFGKSRPCKPSPLLGEIEAGLRQSLAPGRRRRRPQRRQMELDFS